MEHYAGNDVSLESASVCVVDASGRIVREAKVASEPEVLIGWFGMLGLAVTRIGLEAGPLSQWLYAGMREAGLPVELLETRHVPDAFKAMPVKTDRKDARGIAQLMRLGWFRSVPPAGSWRVWLLMALSQKLGREPARSARMSAWPRFATVAIASQPRSSSTRSGCMSASP